MADSLEQVVYDYLTADTSFMSNFSAVYWVEADAQTFPYVVFWQIDDAGTKAYLGVSEQGEARIQFSLWDDAKARGVRLRGVLRRKLEEMNETRGGYTVYVTGITETTVQRETASDPFQFVVDAVIAWRA